MRQSCPCKQAEIPVGLQLYCRTLQVLYNMMVTVLPCVPWCMWSAGAVGCGMGYAPLLFCALNNHFDGGVYAGLVDLAIPVPLNKLTGSLWCLSMSRQR